MKKYYVYAYLRENRCSPYYVGKGQNRRAFANHRFTKVPPRDRIVFIKKNLTEQEALDLEKVIILFYGCEWNGGILENRRTRGGKSYITEETKRKISESGKGKRLGNTNAHRVPVVYGGVFYPSIASAARSVGIQPRTIKSHLKNGGRGKPKGGPKKPIIYKGVAYPSHSAAAKENGVDRTTIVRHGHSMDLL
jgi:hypothetical protein